MATVWILYGNSTKTILAEKSLIWYKVAKTDNYRQNRQKWTILANSGTNGIPCQKRIENALSNFMMGYGNKKTHQ